MAAGPFDVYSKSLEKVLKQTLDLTSANLRAMLLVDGHTASLDVHEFVSDVVANECGDTDYNRQNVTTPDLSLAANIVSHDFDDISFGASVTIAARYLVIFDFVSTDANSPILYICDLNTGGGNLSSTAGAFDITIDAAGAHQYKGNVP